MPSAPVRYFLKHPIRVVSTIVSEPAETWTAFHDRRMKRRERPARPDLYQADTRWEQRLHEALGVSLPCPAMAEFWQLWPEVIGELQEKGVRPGPESFKAWNDGDAGFVRAIWCLVRHLRPNSVVETGVAHGVTSRFILEALDRNRAGHLWSIDHPPLEHVWRRQIALAVGGRFGERWSYIRGSSRRHLPSVLSKLGRLDLFIHDSLHSEHNVRFEMDCAWAALRPGGALVVDDIDTNRGFETFTRAFPADLSLACEAEPLRPDMRRFNEKGLFGVVLKERPANAR